MACRLHKFGMVCPDADTLKRGSAILEIYSRTTPDNAKKRLWTRDIQDKLKNLDKEHRWPFDYIDVYPFSPLQLPQDVLDWACGTGVRPVQPPPFFKSSDFAFIVQGIPYKRASKRSTAPALPIQPHRPAASALLPSASASLGPFAHLLQQAFGPGHLNHPWWSTMNSSGMPACGNGDIPIKFNRKPSTLSIRTTAGPEHVKGLAPSALEPELGDNNIVDVLADIEAKQVQDGQSRGRKRKRARAGVATKPATRRPKHAAKPKTKATPDGKLDKAHWIRTNVTADAAASSQSRRYFISKMHYRIQSEGYRYNLTDEEIGTLRDEVRAKAAAVYDSVHNHG